MNEIKVSIIVPVYNVEKYLTGCMESLVNQTLKDIEIIVVNDGSPDNSIKILEKYEKKYPDKVRVFTTENRGVSHARNYGMDHATGDYIMFVDSDDFIELDMAEKLYTKAVKDQNDLVMCARYNVYEVEGKTDLKRKAMNIFSMNQNFRMKDRKFELVHASPFPWDKLFKRTLLSGIRFPEGIRFEDLVLAFEAVATAESIGVVPEPLYNYRKTTQVGFLNSFSEATKDIVKAFTLLFEFMKEHDLFDTFHDELEYICTRHFFFRYESFYSDTKKGMLQLKKEIVNQTQDFLEREIPNWPQNHYLNYTAGPALKKHLNYYVDRNKTIKYVVLRERIPSKVYNLFLKLSGYKDKFVNKWRKFVKTKKKMAAINKKIRKLRIFKLFKKPLDLKYTKYYETLAVNDKLILFESKHGDDLAGNIFNMILETGRDKYRDFRILLVLRKELYETYRKLLQHYNINHVTFIELHSNEYLRALAAAKYLVTDTSLPPYYIKKPEQVYLNTWHGTPLKAMGRIVPDREYALGNVQRNFNIADYLLYQNEFSKDIFLKDYMLDKIYEGKVLLSGYPRNSSFFRTERRDIIRKECDLEGMQVIVYMPTWRGLLHKKQSKAQVEKIFGYLAHLDHKLTKNQVLYVKLHPYVKKSINYSQLLHVREFPSDYETYDFLNASDMLITDYSSIMFDYAVSKKKIILFTYDREEYLGDRGIYIGLDEMDLPKVDTVDELVAEINNEEYSYPKFYEKFCSLDTADTAKNVCDTVFLNEENKVKTEVYKKDKKDNILVFVKSIRNNEEDHKFIDSMNRMDINKNNFYLHFKAGAMKKSSEMLSLLDKEIGYLPLSPGRNYTMSEYIAFTLTFRFGIENTYTKNKLQSLAKREKQKFYGNTNFEYVINYSGMDLMLLHIFDNFQGKKIYYFQDFNLKKYNSSKKYRKNVQYALRNLLSYDLIIVPSSMKKLSEISPIKNKTLILDNEEAITIERILKEVK
ncbi:bifunctional glycosyltransferase/CDP-glycerol:glycerophosphate glycerophosphotransferase [Anaerocolumna sp. MB42-C2]|uniref:bifunctional glycosyltransferase/CDP-glycerol:glycerophosphate glycerophosphotransferase n=1 Tax=Anaerocolumna sp. MB42-C2 TaxID=3070997 RepID=UPI0027E1FE1A|nr:CDP-glycerol glycerophosphotransferase family protein [Anaerocolumna sp. MB42-C2]WMJ89818.1 CDP-glycerol glycerophosphotransferase family protein [Anaerocolumna sp. MB42-C2]